MSTVVLGDANCLNSTNQWYLPAPSKMLRGRWYGDDDHYRVNNKNAEDAEIAHARKHARKSMHMIVSLSEHCHTMCGKNLYKKRFLLAEKQQQLRVRYCVKESVKQLE